MAAKKLFNFKALNARNFISSDVAILIILWLISAIFDCLWLTLDHSIPAWDQSAHLIHALNHWRVLQHIQIFSGSWWNELWQQATSYRAPFVYLVTVPVFNLLGRGADQATLVNLIFTALLLASVYQLGKHIFTPKIGLWAAGLCLLFPSLISVRIDYLLDYGITAIIIFSFLSLTYWRDAITQRSKVIWCVIFGLSFGLVLLAKPTGLLFFIFPLFLIFFQNVIKKQWINLLQLAISFSLSWLICGFWYQKNWLTIITSALAANAVGKSEGDPSPNTLEGWLFYWKILPNLISLPLLVVSLGCLLLYLWFAFRGKKTNKYSLEDAINNAEKNDSHPKSNHSKSGWGWLGTFLLGVYIFCSLATNKDLRFILPILPVVALILAYGLTIWSSSWGKKLRWGTAAVVGVLLVYTFFPVPGGEKLSWRHLPYLGLPWSHSEVISEVAKTTPYLRSTIGVIPVYTPEINPHNIDYYGNLADFQVYGRQLAFSLEKVPKDVRSLVWYITKTGEPVPQGRIDQAQVALQTAIEQSNELQLHKTWSLPDGNQLKLYRRRLLPVTVEPITETLNQVRLEAVTVPKQAFIGKPVPVTYQLSGSWEALQDGLVLLTWQGKTGNWLHDHGIGLGQLYAGATPLSTQGFRVVERLAMLPPEQISPGKYTLKAVYLNRKTSKTYPLSAPPVEITLKSCQEVNCSVSTAEVTPELDLITQLHQLGLSLSQGKLDPVFQQIGYLNQYDPLQDYLVQTEQALSDRLNREPKNVQLAYTLALSQALQRRVEPLLETLSKITQIDATNSYAWTYLGFVRLYNWQPRLAEKALQVAENLNPPVAEVKILKAIASVMKLNLPQAWERFQALPHAKAQK